MFGMDVDPNEILEGLKGASDFEVLYPADSACACSGSFACYLHTCSLPSVRELRLSFFLHSKLSTRFSLCLLFSS